MPSIVEQRLQNKKETIKHINEKVQEEVIMPTDAERKYINQIIETISNKFKTELTDENINQDDLNSRMEEDIKREVAKLPVEYEQQRRLEKLAIMNIIGLGPLQEFLDDPDVTEIIVQRYDNICVERAGKVYKVNSSFTDEEHLRNVINRILQPVGREVNRSSPIVDAHLKDGSRVCATIPPVSPKGSTLSIRKFNNDMMTAQKYLELKSLTEPILEFLKLCITGRISIFVSGGTSTGKTTFLNMLSSYLPDDELIITIEDTLELQLKQPNVRALETRPIKGGTMDDVDMNALVKTSLRMRPDRIIVGETRDGAVVSLLSAMSTGHEGSMSTGHANSPYNLVNVRIPTMMEMDKTSTFTERAQQLMISEALQMIVQLRRLPSGRRVVSQICEVGGVMPDGKIELHDIFRYDQRTDQFVATGYIPHEIIDQAYGYGVDIPETLFKEGTAE